MKNAQIDTASFIPLSGATGVWHTAHLFFPFPDILFTPFVLLCIGLNASIARLNDAYATCLAPGSVYIFMENSDASLRPASAIDSHLSRKDKRTHLSGLV